MSDADLQSHFQLALRFKSCLVTQHSREKQVIIADETVSFAYPIPCQARHRCANAAIVFSHRKILLDGNAQHLFSGNVDPSRKRDLSMSVV